MNIEGKGGFVKGVSGNPGGRPKEIAEVRALARQYTPLAIERLVHWCQSDDPRASVVASTALLDRGWGKATQVIAGDSDAPLQITEIRRVIVTPMYAAGGSVIPYPRHEGLAEETKSRAEA